MIGFFLQATVDTLANAANQVANAAETAKEVQPFLALTLNVSMNCLIVTANVIRMVKPNRI
jgi:hypothetical protein